MFNSINKKKDIDRYGKITVDLSDPSKKVFRLMYRVLGQQLALKEGNTLYYDVDTEICPFVYFGPTDLSNDADIGDMSKWALGPVDFQWNDDEKVWEAGGLKIHHHINNTKEQGGIAFAYFFR